MTITIIMDMTIAKVISYVSTSIRDTDTAKVFAIALPTAMSLSIPQTPPMPKPSTPPVPPARPWSAASSMP